MGSISSVIINNKSLDSTPTVTKTGNSFTISGTDLPTGLTSPGGVTWSFAEGSGTTSSITTSTATSVVGTFNYTPGGPSIDDAIVTSTLSLTVGSGTTPRYPATGSKPVKVPNS